MSLEITDDLIPHATRQSGQSRFTLVPIGTQPLERRGELVGRLSSIKDADRVSCLDELFNDVPANEQRAAENENVHRQRDLGSGRPAAFDRQN
jgi:hypothetical protein